MSTLTECGCDRCMEFQRQYDKEREVEAMRARAERAEAALRACDEALDELGCGACAVPPEADVGAVPGAVREAMTTLRTRLAEERRQHVESRRALSMALATAQDVARRQREACAATMAKCSSVWGDMVRATPLVTDQEEP